MAMEKNKPSNKKPGRKLEKISKNDVTRPVLVENSERRFRGKTWHAIAVLILILTFFMFKVADYYPRKISLAHRPDFFGTTFSTKFCEELELDWKEVYSAILDDLKVKYIRIPVYWDEIEKTEGVYDFSNYDYLLNEGEKRGVKFILTTGRRVPRWPECHSPAWLNRKDIDAVKVDTLKMLKTVINRYKDRPSIEYWQVENEAFLGTFGVCPPLDEGFLQQEVDLVRSLDKRKIIITGSGELGFWRKEAKLGDIFGSTLYRVVYNSQFGFVKYPLPTAYYKMKAKLAGLTPDRVMVLELQAEPWVPKGKMIYLTEDGVSRSLSVDQFKANLQYAINLNFGRTYTWGTEWWYWQKKFGNPEYWRIAEEVFN